MDIKSSHKLAEFTKLTIWGKMTELAVKTNSINLGQGFPNWEPELEFKQAIAESVVTNGNSQYQRSYGLSI